MSTGPRGLRSWLKLKGGPKIAPGPVMRDVVGLVRGNERAMPLPELAFPADIAPADNPRCPGCPIRFAPLSSCKVVFGSMTMLPIR